MEIFKILRITGIMETGRKIDLFGVMAILLFGAIIGGGATYQQMDTRMQSLEQQINDISNQEPDTRLIYVNSTNEALTELYKTVDDSAVSVTTYGPSNSQGSGFIYSKKGYIVTNQHVIEGSTRVEVTFTDGTTKTASVVGTDPYTDLAVLKAEKKGLNPLELANSSTVEVGQMAVAIGNPFGLKSTMTEGIISQKGRVLPVEGGFSIPNVLQTDAAINPGNSGGPLLNRQGEVVGVNTAIETQTGTFSGVGFAIPANTVNRVVPQLIATGDYQHPYLGVRGLNVDSSIAEEMGLENARGFMISQVPNGTAADKAGLRGGQYQAVVKGQRLNLGGDVIVGINNTEIRSLQDVLVYLAREAEVGDTVEVTVIRDGERITFDLKLEARPET